MQLEVPRSLEVIGPGAARLPPEARNDTGPKFPSIGYFAASCLTSVTGACYLTALTEERMGTLERRARARDSIRTRILDAAREMFARDGVDAVTMRAIAKRIEYTPTTIYHHFRDKHALLLELCQVDMAALAQGFQRIGRIEDPAERLSRLGMAYVDFAIEHPAHYQFLFMTPKPDVLADDPIAALPDQNAYLMLLATVREGIEAGRYRPEFDDPHQLAQLAWGALHGVVSLHIAKGCESWIQWRDVRESARAMVDLLMRGIRRTTD